MTIIGLLIGAILKGQELVQNARRQTVIAQIQSYDAATTTFHDAYGALPGDLNRATERITNCLAPDCVDGNGDGRGGAPLAVWWTTLPATAADESTQYWRHLAFANLITGVDPTAAAPGFGTMVPAAKTGNGFFASSVAHPNGAEGYPEARAMSGLALFIRNSTTAVIINTENRSISPHTAAYFDQKMDDGVALAGSVQAVSSSTIRGCGSSPNGPNGYTASSTRNTCEIAFKIRN